MWASICCRRRRTVPGPENVWCNEDGSLNLPAPQKPERRVEANIPGHYFYYMGYQTTDEVFRYMLEPYTDNYELTQSYAG